MAKFRILALDGGGIRGAFGAALLAELEERLGAPLTTYFDLVAGTSTGAIIAASLASGMPANDDVDFYDRYGAKIFKPRPLRVGKGWTQPFYPMARSILGKLLKVNFDDFFRAKFCPFALDESFEEAFGDLTLGRVANARLVVPTVRLNDGRTQVFRTPHLPSHLQDVDVKIKDLLVAATAAPTYFPHKTMPDGTVHIDGGLFAVNPAMIALAEAMKIQQLCTRETCDPRYDTSDIQILSIGTGNVNFSLEPPGADAGQLYWASKIATVMGASQVDGLQAPLEFVLGDRYRRVNFDLPDPTWTLDCVQHIPKLFELGRRWGEELIDDLGPTFFEEESPAFRPFSQSSL